MIAGLLADKRALEARHDIVGAVQINCRIAVAIGFDGVAFAVAQRVVKRDDAAVFELHGGFPGRCTVNLEAKTIWRYGSVAALILIASAMV